MRNLKKQGRKAKKYSATSFDAQDLERQDSLPLHQRLKMSKGNDERNESLTQIDIQNLFEAA